MTTKKRNPTDTTLRNTRAANKKITALEDRVQALITRVEELAEAVSVLSAWMRVQPKESSRVSE